MTNNSIGTPLAMEKTTTTLRKKALEKERKVETGSGPKTSQRL